MTQFTLKLGHGFSYFSHISKFSVSVIDAFLISVESRHPVIESSALVSLTVYLIYPCLEENLSVTSYPKFRLHHIFFIKTCLYNSHQTNMLQDV